MNILLFLTLLIFVAINADEPAPGRRDLGHPYGYGYPYGYGRGYGRRDLAPARRRALVAPESRRDLYYGYGGLYGRGYGHGLGYGRRDLGYGRGYGYPGRP